MGGQGAEPPFLPICTQDYVHNNLLTEVVIVLICVHYIKVAVQWH